MGVLIFLVATGILIGIDQFTKVLAIDHLKDQPAIPIIPDVFELTYVENRGAAFGMMQGRQAFFVIITVVIIAVILYYYFKVLADKKYKPLKFCFILITAGAIGNFIDRVYRGVSSGNLLDRLNEGFVVDFFYFKLIDFPVFNVADCYVVVGTILFALLIFTKYREDLLEE